MIHAKESTSAQSEGSASHVKTSDARRSYEITRAHSRVGGIVKISKRAIEWPGNGIKEDRRKKKNSETVSD